MGEHLTRAATAARRRHAPMSVLMIDLDRFKETNDRHGHGAGDLVLNSVADCLREMVRGEDVAGRWGGDEFVVLLPDTDEHAAQAVAQRLQEAALQVDLSDIGLPHGVEMSVGAATAILTTPAEIVHEADVALYRAKTSARRAQAGHADDREPSAT
jgi:diguanylate cyclase (GGDEF)-like protein